MDSRNQKILAGGTANDCSGPADTRVAYHGSISVFQGRPCAPQYGVPFVPSVGAAAGQSHAFAAVLELHRRTLLRELPELARDESIIAEVEADEVTKLV